MASASPAPVDDRGVVLRHHDAAGLAQALEPDVLQLEADLFADNLAAGEDGHVGQHRLAAVTETGRLDRHDVQQAANLVHDQRGKGLTVDVLGNDHERLLGLGDLFQQRQEIRHRGDLACVQQDVRVVRSGFHPLRVGHEVRGDVALIELHSLGELELEAHGRRFLDGDDTVLADLAERLGDELADLRVLRGDRRHVRDLLLLLDLAGRLQQQVGHGGGRRVDPLLHGHGVGARGDGAAALADHRLRQHGRGRGAVAGHVVGLGGYFLGELSPQILVGVLEVDLTRDGHAVVGDGRSAPLLIDDDVAALRTQRHLRRRRRGG